jgi:hypothetical protein
VAPYDKRVVDEACRIRTEVPEGHIKVSYQVLYRWVQTIESITTKQETSCVLVDATRRGLGGLFRLAVARRAAKVMSKLWRVDKTLEGPRG